MKTKLFLSESTNPWFNLSFEEYLVNQVKEDEIYFYLWQNQHTVVIGKHQNPWREVRVAELEAESGKLARRLSGGGAVYHDLGNLNFTFVMHKKHENLPKQLNVILSAVKTLGVNAAFSGRNDILAEGRKFSGNAFYYGKNNYYHHGTVLVDVDMPNLGKYLNVSMKKLESKGVESVKSRVINLKEINPEITVDQIKIALRQAFELEYGALAQGEVHEVSENHAPIEAIERFNHYASWEWRFGKSPDFEVTFDEKFSWGEVVLEIRTKNAKASEIQVFSDAMSTQFIDALKATFSKVRFDKTEMMEALNQMVVSESEMAFLNDFVNWFETLPI